MSGEPQLYRINPENRQSDRIEEVDFARLGLRERRDIQEWVAANPGILGDDLLVIGKEFSGFDLTSERLDLLAVDLDGKLVIIELKRDDTGSDVHWQAIKYASYFQRVNADEIVDIAAKYWAESRSDSVTRMLQHLGADDLNALNNDQRIILASHRFAPEVTSAALWLNLKVPDLITCVKLTPFQDKQNGALYVQASAIIPVPEVDDYLVGVLEVEGYETRLPRELKSGAMSPGAKVEITDQAKSEAWHGKSARILKTRKVGMNKDGTPRLDYLVCLDDTSATKWLRIKSIQLIEAVDSTKEG